MATDNNQPSKEQFTELKVAVDILKVNQCCL